MFEISEKYEQTNDDLKRKNRAIKLSKRKISKIAPVSKHDIKPETETLLKNSSSYRYANNLRSAEPRQSVDKLPETDNLMRKADFFAMSKNNDEDIMFSLRKTQADVSTEAKKRTTYFKIGGNIPPVSNGNSKCRIFQLKNIHKYKVQYGSRLWTISNVEKLRRTNASKKFYDKKQKSQRLEYDRYVKSQKKEQLIKGMKTAFEYGEIAASNDDIEEKAKNLTAKGAAQIGEYVLNEAITPKKVQYGFKTSAELNGYNFSTKSADAANTFNKYNSCDTAGIISAAASKAAQATSSDADEARKKQFFIDTAVAAGKIAASGGADAPEAVVSYANSQLQQQKQKSSNGGKWVSFADSGSSGAVVAVIAVLLAVIVAVVPTISVVYPFYYLAEKVTGFFDEVGNWFEDIAGKIGNFIKGEKTELKDSPFPDTIAHYYAIMNEMVKSTNDDVNNKISGKEDKEMSDQMQYDPSYYDKKNKYDANKFEYDNKGYYYDENGYHDTPPVEPDKSDYELPKRQQKKFEGYFWEEDTEGTSVPYEMFYDEVLCTLAAYNASIMTDGMPNVSYKTEKDPETGEEKQVVDKITYLPPPDEPVYLTDDEVEQYYNYLPFWSVELITHESYCKGCEEETVTKRRPIFDDNGNITGFEVYEEEESYCPGHVTIGISIHFNWDINKYQENLYAGSSFEMLYDSIWEQYQKDK